MTVLSTDLAYEQYSGNGTQTYFEYGFELTSETQVHVTVDGVPVTFEYQANGVVISPAPPQDSVILVMRETEITQLRDFQAFDSFNAAWTEDACDKLILLKQEAAIWRALCNLYALQPVEKVEIVNDKGSNADIFLWNLDMSGAFSGEVTMAMPAAGAVVEKPWDFAYFQYGDEEVLSQQLTTTLYPAEAEDAIVTGMDIETFAMGPIPTDGMNVDSESLGGIKIQTLLDMPLQEDAMDVPAGAILSVDKVVTLIEMPQQEDAMDVPAGAFLSAVKETKLVTAYAPDEAILPGLDIVSFTMTAV